MHPAILALVIVALVVLGILAQRLGWVDFSNKTRSGGSSGSIAGIGDEVFHPTKFETQVELDRQTILPAPAPLAGDGDKGIYDGKVKLNLDDVSTRN
jgi:hypothetical protein